ncbi:MAG: hypothetical protein ETSY2_02635 [Candidatus Entotheonella gemina]|uniref:Rieske domain-containing protein n=2 Tax=Candidatus Entotheonella TaxID=93171 RepID=W4MFC3_9BACT|nr:MAG: hypothetical protein ETSY2_02635 [Candidatus Entotheonella gemina]
MPMLRNYWYIACATPQVQGRPQAAQVLDQALVIFRDAAGQPHALLDRCCHRGVELSLGEVVENTLTCRYHGWRFDGDGHCVHIPSLTAERHIPNGCQVPSLLCREQDGYVWVWMGQDGAEPPEPPRLPGFEQYQWLQGSQPWQCASLLALQNGIDWCHPAFVHQGIHAQSRAVQARGLHETAYEMRLLGEGLEVFALPAAASDARIPEQASTVLRFELPDRVLVHWPQQDERVILHFVPTGHRTCRHEWLYHGAGMRGVGVTWSEAEPEVMAQDREIVESAQRSYDAYGDAFEHSVEADAATLMLRRIVALAAEGRWEGERGALRQRRVVPVRS